MKVLRPWGLFVTLCLPGVVLATTAAPRTLEELARQADRVVLARVMRSQVRVPQGNVRQMTTVTQVEVLEEYQGKGPRALEVVQLGGRSGPWESRLAGDATLTEGETALFFLRCPDPKAVTLCGLVGLGAGKSVVTAGEDGQRQVQIPAQMKGGPVTRPLSAVIEEIRRAGSPPASQKRGKR
ncbi:hypothetical protein [Stigmatella aurantiaca]|uniref:Uncharacterized protein n=2 Tax=Stigmatella aurantiaca (strain DW4/3-1) TaxID=378806 RepID=E3FZY0_STIAD|nr:hypothetical protein [Stigmatella aurantiaca]ADO71183.1 uncharacterized protein STAUR_3391 [Stigmatella aurantiaca DW4/3-1]